VETLDQHGDIVNIEECEVLGLPIAPNLLYFKFKVEYFAFLRLLFILGMSLTEVQVCEGGGSTLQFEVALL
jgi:hypothetical protein